MLYSNEIVFRGHPDKVCDQISDAIVDECLKQDKTSRCAVEVVGGKGKIFITGEVTTKAVFDVSKIVKRVLLDVGYDDNYEIINNLGTQSPDIARGVTEEFLGAGDNGMMFGYATRDTCEYLPVAMVILQKFSKCYDELRKRDKRFLSDGKAEITGFYENNKLKYIKTFTICYQNTEKERDETDKILIGICDNICLEYGVKVLNYLINPTGKFLIGGFLGDAGLTGRKIVVDSYQSFAKCGGGAFSGKDPSKVDRSGAYKARSIAKEILRDNPDYNWCLVQISYAIGVERPVSIYIETDKGVIDTLDKFYEECKPKNIIKDLNLRNICYEDLAKFGHFMD